MTQIQVRRDTAANWESNNPVLAEGEWGYDTTNRVCKIGDGTRAWNNIYPQVRDGDTLSHGLNFSTSGSEWGVSGTGLSYIKTGDDFFQANILKVQSVISGTTRDDYIVLGDDQMMMFEPSHITKLLLCSKQRPSVITSYMNDYSMGGGELVAYLSDIKEYTSGDGINITEAEPEYTSVFGTLTGNTVADDYEFQVSNNPNYVANQSDMYKLYSDTDDVAAVIVDNSPVEFAIIDSQKRFRAGDKIKVEMTIQLVQQVRQIGITIAGNLGLTGPTVRDTSDQTLTYELTLNEDLDKFTYTISTFVDSGYSGNRFYLKKFKISKANSNLDQREISLAPATTSVLGGVKPDGSTITVTADGTISATGSSGPAVTDTSAIVYNDGSANYNILAVDTTETSVDVGISKEGYYLNTLSAEPIQRNHTYTVYDTSQNAAIAGLAFPHVREFTDYEEIPSGVFNPPSAGFLYINKTAVNVGEYIQATVSEYTSGEELFGVDSYAVAANQELKLFIPVTNLMSVSITTTATGTTNAFRFIKAMGAGAS